MPPERKRRRPAGRGTVIQRAPGVWRVRVRWTTEDGRHREREVRVQGSRASAEEALDALRQALVRGDLDHASDTPTGRLTVRAYLTDWLTHQAGRVAPSSLTRYREALTRHVVPALGDVLLVRLRPIAVQRLVTALPTGTRGRAPLSPASTRLVLGIFRSALEQAVRWEMLPRNPARYVQGPAGGQEEQPALTGEQVDALLDAAERAGDPLLPLWTLGAFGGLRIGECLALTWGAVELPAPDEPDAWGRLSIRKAKTRAGRREIALAPEVVTSLRRLSRGLPGAPVFASAARGGRAYSPSAVHRALRAALRRAGLPLTYTFHSFRRGVASAAVAAGDVAGASALLGHARRSLTLDKYARPLPGAADRAAGVVRDALRGHPRGNGGLPAPVSQEGTG